MPETTSPAAGQVGWIDLTMPEAERVCAFCEHVAGWTASPVSMGDQKDAGAVAALYQPE